MFSANQPYYLIGFFLVMNVATFVIMLVDKLKAMTPGSTRISEGMLFFLGTIFGSLGVYVGMFVFHHKSRKWYFVIGVPLLFIENLSLLYLIYLYNNNFFS